MPGHWRHAHIYALYAVIGFRVQFGLAADRLNVRARDAEIRIGQFLLGVRDRLAVENLAPGDLLRLDQCGGFVRFAGIDRQSFDRRGGLSDNRQGSVRRGAELYRSIQRLKLLI